MILINLAKFLFSFPKIARKVIAMLITWLGVKLADWWYDYKNIVQSTGPVKIKL